MLFILFLFSLSNSYNLFVGTLLQRARIRLFERCFNASSACHHITGMRY